MNKRAATLLLRIVFASLSGVCLLAIIAFIAPIDARLGVLAGGLTLALFWLLIETSRMRRRKRKRLFDREFMTNEELCMTFGVLYVSRQDLLEFLELVSRATETPKGLLRPTDRFTVELAPEKGWEFDDGVNLLPSLLSNRFGGAPGDFALEHNATVSDLLKRVAEQFAARAKPGLQEL